MTKRKGVALNSERVAYLERAYVLIQGRYREAPPLEAVMITVGWPAKRARATNTAVGECFHDVLTSGAPVLSISPAVCESAEAAIGTLCHEAIHAAFPDAKHGLAFKREMRVMGLEGKATETVVGKQLGKIVESWVSELGEWPEEGVIPPKPVLRKPGSRLRKWVCDCGIIARVASDAFVATCGRCGADFCN